MILTFAACENTSKSIINYNLSQEPETLDPAIASDTAATTVIDNLFEGLCTIDSNGNLKSGAANWFRSNDEQTEFTFYLRENAIYSDGTTPVTANDFVFEVERVLSPDTNSPYAKNLYCIKNARTFNESSCSFDEVGVKAVDEYTLQFELEYPYEQFPMLTTKTYLMPCNKAYFKSSKNMYGLESSSLLTNGVFSFSSKNSWIHNESITLSRSSTYTGLETAVPQGINFTINYEEISNGNKTDAKCISAEEYKDDDSQRKNEIYFEDTVWGIMFNLNDSVYNDKELRIKLLSRIDNDENLYHLPQNCSVANGILPPESELLGKPYREQVGNANLIQYDETASATEEINRINGSGTTKFTPATILCLDTENSKAIASNILQAFNDSTSKYYNIEPLPYDELISRIEKGKYQIAIAPINCGQGEAYDILSSFTSNNENNLCNLTDSTYDAILNNALTQPSEIIQAENYILDNGVFYPLYFENRCFVTPDNVTAVSFYPFQQGISFKYTQKI